MTEVEKLILLMNVSTKLINADESVFDEIELLNGVEVDVDLQLAIENIEDNIASNVSKDFDYASFINIALLNSTFFDMDYILCQGYILGVQGIPKDKLIQLLNEGKRFKNPKRTLQYLHSLSLSAISSCDVECMKLATEKIIEFNLS